MKIILAIPTIFKSMFYQANWNTENLQATGFRWLLKDLFKRNKITYTADIDITKDYFNTNPYLITFLLGMMLKEAESKEKLLEYEKVYASALAALGDNFFWHSLRPFAFFLSLFIAISKPFLAIFIYLSIFNIFHFGFRFLGYYIGYNLGKDVIHFFTRIRFKSWGKVADRISTVMVGGAIIFMLKINPVSFKFEYIVAGIFSFVLGYFLSRRISIPYGLILFSTFLIIYLVVF